MRYLLAEEILAIHDRLIERIGGIKGIRDMNLLHSIAQRPRMAMLGREFYPDVFTKTAVYLEGLAVFHVFADGNKRTSIAVAHFFLRANGYKLTAPTDQAFRFILAVAVKKKTIEETATWLKKNSKKVR